MSGTDQGGTESRREARRDFLRYNRSAVAVGEAHVAVILPDGSVAAFGENGKGQCDTGRFQRIRSVACCMEGTIGLDADGAIVCAGICGRGRFASWRDVVELSCGGDTVVAVCGDGRFRAQGDLEDWFADSARWSGPLERIALGGGYAVALKKDGTAVAAGTGENKKGPYLLRGNRRFAALRDREELQSRCDVSGWRNLAAVACGIGHTVGLLSDGTLIATGKFMNTSGQEEALPELSAWTDIVDIACGDCYVAGLTAEGTVVAAGIGCGQDGQAGWLDCLKEWRDIVAIACGRNFVLGLLPDGALVVAERNGDAFAEKLKGKRARVILTEEARRRMEKGEFI